MNSGNLKSCNAQAVAEVGVGSLPSINSILPTTPSLVQSENIILRKMNSTSIKNTLNLVKKNKVKKICHIRIINRENRSIM